MNDKIIPRLGSIEFFQEDSFHPAQTPVYDGNEWYIEGEFSVVDELTREYNRKKPFYKRKKGNKNGDLGHVFPFVICSPGYAQKYKKAFQDSECIPIIMETFSVTDATQLVSDKIEQAGDHVTIDRLWKHLATFSDTEYDSGNEH